MYVCAGLVLFLSDVVVHRVLPCTARRFCFTIWLDGDGTNTPASLRLDSRVAPTSLHVLDPSTRQLSRAVYAEEYAASIRETFADSPEQCALVLASHEDHVSNSMANAALARLVHEARTAIRERQRQAAPPPAGPSGGGGDLVSSDSHAVVLCIRAAAADRVLASVRAC